MDNHPYVSVWVVAFNQERFIERCIRSILSQRTDFSFEIVVGEDCSVDGTRQILSKMARENNNVIRLITSDANVGIVQNVNRTKKACRGVFIASCEGDDYWTDSLKLQKQLDYMISNPDVSMSFHNALIYWGTSNKVKPIVACPKKTPDFLTTSAIIEKWDKWQIPSASRMFRSELMMDKPDFFSEFEFGDFTTAIYCSLVGKVAYIAENMSVYQKHSGGWTSNKSMRSAYQDKLRFFELFNEYTGHAFIKSTKRNLKLHPNSRFNFIWMQLFRIPKHIMNPRQAFYKMRFLWKILFIYCFIFLHF